MLPIKNRRLANWARHLLTLALQPLLDAACMEMVQAGERLHCFPILEGLQANAARLLLLRFILMTLQRLPPSAMPDAAVSQATCQLSKLFLKPEGTRLFSLPVMLSAASFTSQSDNLAGCRADRKIATLWLDMCICVGSDANIVSLTGLRLLVVPSSSADSIS